MSWRGIVRTSKSSGPLYRLESEVWYTYAKLVNTTYPYLRDMSAGTLTVRETEKRVGSSASGAKRSRATSMVSQVLWVRDTILVMLASAGKYSLPSHLAVKVPHG